MEPTVVGCMTEKVSPLGKLKVVKSLLAKIKYRFIILKVQKNIDFLLPIGNEALLYFEKLGWRKESHSIFYIPDLKFDASNLHEESGNEFYCYIGRNDYDGKGLNLPVSYFKKHPDKKLLIIGDYGKKTKKVTEIIKKHKNIHRVDSIEPDEIICFCKTNKVKCIVVPSKSDGWNPNVYISMLGLIPCLCSTKTGNSSLVSDYGAGVVFKPNKKSFDKAMRTFDAMDSDDIKKIQSNEKMFILENSPKEHSQKLLVFLESVTKKL